MTFPLCPTCGRETKPCHKLHRELWVDDGYKCRAIKGGCGRYWTSEQLRGFERDKQDVDTQATRYVQATVRRRKRAERLSRQLPVVEVKHDQR